MEVALTGSSVDDSSEYVITKRKSMENAIIKSGIEAAILTVSMVLELMDTHPLTNVELIKDVREVWQTLTNELAALGEQ